MPDKPIARGLDPSLQAILEKAAADREEALQADRRREEAQARIRRLNELVGRFGGVAPAFLQAELLRPPTRDEFLHHWASRIGTCAQSLLREGLQGRLDELEQGRASKQFAVEVLRRGMAGDEGPVVTLLREADEFTQLASEVEFWLRLGLIREILRLAPPPEPPPGWEGSYLEPVETVDDFVRWIEQQFLLREPGNREPGNRLSDGRLVRNAFRLVTKLELPGIPLEPTGPLTVNDELAVLRNLRRLCPKTPRSKRQANGSGMRKHRGGKPPLEQSNPVKFQVYERIKQEHQPGEYYADTVDRLKIDTAFVEQVQEAGLGRLDTKLVRKALAFYDHRHRGPARKKQ
jgi:hypothetical protein